MALRFIALTVIALCAFTWAAPTVLEHRDNDLVKRAATPYAPVSATCPSTPLVRPATSINSNEAAYVSSRKTNADTSLSKWLKQRGAFSTSSLPVVGFTSSGGGYRSLLTTAGVVQGFDSRDSDVGTSGVYQGLVYQAGLSGGSWFLSSLAANNWPTVSSLKTRVWEQAFTNSLLVPANLLSTSGATEYAKIVKDLTEKEAAGFPVTIVDPYGRLLSYQLLYGNDGGVADRLSGLTRLSNFTSSNVPYPIITTTEDFPGKGQCEPTLSGPIWEFHPYEYGSWDKGVASFAQTKYMGTTISNGKPTGTCTVHYDNIGYIFGTSSDVFNSNPCATITPTNDTSNLPGVLEAIVALVQNTTVDDQFGIYPNPFHNYPRASLVRNQKTLTLSDGGESDQNNPIWPFIQTERNVDVLIVNDNSADTSDNFPNGTEIYQTYVNAQADGLTKMPFIPDVATFVSEGLNKRATFFGCNETDTMFIVYLPNVNYTYSSNQPTSKVEYTVAETDGMIENGVAIATQNGTTGWPKCLACAIDNKASNLPAGCAHCFKKYCYQQ